MSTSTNTLSTLDSIMNSPPFSVKNAAHKTATLTILAILHCYYSNRLFVRTLLRIILQVCIPVRTCSFFSPANVLPAQLFSIFLLRFPINVPFVMSQTTSAKPLAFAQPIWLSHVCDFPCGRVNEHSKAV